MKKCTLIIVFMLISLGIYSQALHIYHNGKSNPDIVANAGVDSIFFEPKHGGIEEYRLVLATKDGLKRYDVVDSVFFNLGHLRATRHEYYVPVDYGCLKLLVSSNEGENPVLTLADGTVVNMGSESKNMYVYDYWAEWNNGQGDSNKRTETWYLSNGTMTDTITVHFTALPFAKNAYTEICFPPEGIEYTIEPNHEGSVLKPDAQFLDWYYDDNGNIVIRLHENETTDTRRVYTCPGLDGFEIHNVYFEQLGNVFKHTPEEHMAALREFCDSTDFVNWGKNTNWWSDKPLWEWGYSLNNHKWSNYYWHINDHVVNLYFGGGQYTGVKGTLPASFEVFLDDVVGELDLTQCALYGKIPYNIRHNENWSKYGWNIIQQDVYRGGGFDMEDINLRIDSVAVEDFVNETVSNTYDILKKNKVTWVFNAGAVDMIDGISDERVNKYLDYCNKGLGVVVTVGGYWDVPYDRYRSYVLNQRSLNGLPESILWTKGFDKGDIGSYGSMTLLDSEGNLLWYGGQYDYGMEAHFMNQVDSVLRSRLGEPEEHKTYISKHYESTDYSHDGEVLVLQEATVGKGIDLVFMGDMYVDTMLVEGGVYEKDMMEAMEYFFDVEPYRALRERFNVYAVKVVSPNGYEGKQHKFNFDNNLVFEYAAKVPGVDMDNVAITVINHNPNFSFFVSGETAMWESGASIAWIEQGGPSNIICHETGGHGFAKLLDEYIYGGYEDNHTQEGANESFREWIKSTYHDKGWGMNISASDEIDDIPWKRFLEDERYKDEVGVYMGAWMWPEELWRPSENSVMNNDYSWFNAPSREAIYKRVMQLSEGDGWEYDYEKFVEFDTSLNIPQVVNQDLWIGEFTVKAGVVHSYGDQEYPEEFTMRIKYDEVWNMAIVTKFMGKDVTTLNYGGIPLAIAEDCRSAEMEIGTYVGGAYPDYIKFYDINQSDSPVLLTVNADETISIEDFLLVNYNWETGLSEVVASYQDVTATKSPDKNKCAKEGDGHAVQRRVISRPPTIYKGTWNNGEKVAFGFEDASKQNASKHKASNRAGERTLTEMTRPCILYKGERCLLEEWRQIETFKD